MRRPSTARTSVPRRRGRNGSVTTTGTSRATTGLTWPTTSGASSPSSIVIRSLLKRYRARGPMLDAGCGTGLNLSSMPSGSVGLDINPRNLALIRSRLPDRMAVEGDIENMPFGDAAFETVVCTEVLEHVPYPERALAEIRRVLRPGGLLLGSVPSRSLIWRLRFLSSTCPGEEPFHNEYRPPEVRAMLGGFEVQRIWLSALHFNVMFAARRPSLTP